MSHLDEKGRCCGRKPLVYKVPRSQKFCTRCDRSYDRASGEQIENWAWKKDASGEFVSTKKPFGSVKVQVSMEG